MSFGNKHVMPVVWLKISLSLLISNDSSIVSEQSLLCCSIRLRRGLVNCPKGQYPHFFKETRQALLLKEVDNVVVTAVTSAHAHTIILSRVYHLWWLRRI